MKKMLDIILSFLSFLANHAKGILWIFLALGTGLVFYRATLLYESSALDIVERFIYISDAIFSEIATNPFVFIYSPMALMMGLLGMTIIGLTYLSVTANKKNYRHGEEYGSARFGTAKEAKNFYSPDPEDNILYSQTEKLALNKKLPPAYDRNKNGIVIGGSGSGKTFRFVKPNLAQKNASFVVVDPKDHLAEKTGKFFKENGYDIKVFDLVNMANTNKFNPFKYIKSEVDLNKMLQTYFNNTKGEGTKSDPFWDESAMTLVRALASYLVDFYNSPETLEERKARTEDFKNDPESFAKWKKEYDAKHPKPNGYPTFAEIGKLIKLVAKGEDEEKSVLEIMFEEYAKTYGTENFTMRNWRDFQNYKDKTLDSVIAVTTAKFALFNIQNVIDLTSVDTMEMETWGEKPTIVYMVLPDNDTTFRFLAALFFSTAFNYQTHKADTVHKGGLPIHLRFIIDEFANVGKIPDFAELTSTVRSRNISIVPILQNLAQIQGLYKEKDAWKTILGNCDSLLYLGGNDIETFKYMSEILGKTTIDIRNDSRSYGSQGSGSTSFQKLARDLMTPNEVSTMPRDECLVKISNTPAFRSKKYNPFKHPNWRYFSNAPDDGNWFDYTDEILTKEERREKIRLALTEEMNQAFMDEDFISIDDFTLG